MGKYYYNGVLLPEIPYDILTEYPYCWIRKNDTSGYYDLVFASATWYYKTDLYCSEETLEPWYRVLISEAANATSWEFNESSPGVFGIDDERTVLWSNHDISKESIANTEIYFEASMPVAENSDIRLVSSIEAETGKLGGTAKVVDRANYSKNVVVDGITSSGGSLTMDFNVSKTGFYLIKMYFTHSGTREFKYLLNGKNYSKEVTGTSYYAIECIEFQLYLNEGENEVIITGGETTYAPMFDKFEIYQYASWKNKYLIREAGKYYLVKDESLEELELSELTADSFEKYGMDSIPAYETIRELINPEILCWTDSTDEVPEIIATMTAVPYPQTIISSNYDMSDDTILGIECAYVTASSDVVFAISVDDGVTWYMWTGTAWGTLTDTTTGMTAETINAITTEQWAGLTTTGQFKVRMTLFDANSSFTSFVMDYVN